MGAKCCAEKNANGNSKKSLWEVIAEKGGRASPKAVPEYAVFIADEHKMLRCAPKNGTPYIPGCQVVRGSVVEMLPVGGTEKYAAVRIHGMLGYMRRKHLVPVATYHTTAQQQHRRAVLVFWLLNKQLGIPPASCVSVVSHVCWEMIPYWLLPGQGESSQDICCTRLLQESHKRSAIHSVSSNRRKELAKYLTAWKVSFSKKYGRGPHALDVWTDATVASMYEEYESIEKARQKGRDSLSNDEQKRRRLLCKQLKQWMTQYQEAHKRIPSKKRLLAEPQVSELYKEYLSLTGKPDPTMSANYHNPYVAVEPGSTARATSSSSACANLPHTSPRNAGTEQGDKGCASECVSPSPSPDRVLSSPAGDEPYEMTVVMDDSGDDEANEEEGVGANLTQSLLSSSQRSASCAPPGPPVPRSSGAQAHCSSVKRQKQGNRFAASVSSISKRRIGA